jgi:hypothetical protein
MTSTNDIPRSFLNHFKAAGHARVPSAPSEDRAIELRDRMPQRLTRRR